MSDDQLRRLALGVGLTLVAFTTLRLARSPAFRHRVSHALGRCPCQHPELDAAIIGAASAEVDVHANGDLH